MTRAQTTRDVGALIGMLILVWLVAMAVLVYGGERRGDGHPSKASDPCEATELDGSSPTGIGTAPPNSNRVREGFG